MSQTVDYQHRLELFQVVLQPHGTVVGLPHPADELPAFADQVATAQLLPFIRPLINVTAKRQCGQRWRTVNRQRLETAKLWPDPASAEMLAA